MAVNDIYSVQVLGTLHGQRVQCTLHYRESVTGVGGGSTALASLADASPGNEFRIQLSNEYRYDGCLVQKIWPLPVLESVLDATAAGNGSIVQNSLPSEVAAVITKRTGLAGRKYRGRAYVPGIPVTYETDSQLNSTGLTGIGAIATKLATALTGSGWTFFPTLYHRAAHTYNDLSQCTARPILRCQRRRQVGRGV